MVASTPSEFPLSRANSLSSNTWRPICPRVRRNTGPNRDIPTMKRMTTVNGDILDGVSATTLWTLYNRGTEAKRPDGVIRDPLAVALFDAISYDYRKFGSPGQPHALRARAFDDATCGYLRTHPKASVVALAEGLQTSLWRLDAAGMAKELNWYSIDLPPVVALREQLLPDDDRIVALAQSALDRSWMD